MKLRLHRKLQESTVETILPYIVTSDSHLGMTNGPLVKSFYDFLLTVVESQYDDDNDLLDSLEDFFVYLDHNIPDSFKYLQVNYEIIDGAMPKIHIELVKYTQIKLMEILIDIPTLRLMARKRKLELGK